MLTTLIKGGLSLGTLLSCSWMPLAFCAALNGQQMSTPQSPNQHKVIVLGGGISGVIAARTLHENGIDDFLLIEARAELGGRIMSTRFEKKDGRSLTIEMGANWIQGTQTGDGPSNPIFDLANRHRLQYELSDFHKSIATFDESGAVDFSDAIVEAGAGLNAAIEHAAFRVDSNLIDVSMRTGFSIVKHKPKSIHARAAEYYTFDWEYGQSADQTSLIAASWVHQATFNSSLGGFSDEDLMSLDQRGFGTIVQSEAQTFLTPDQLLLNATVVAISHSETGVIVTLSNNQTISADYAICTFSLGVLQNDDVQFVPELPGKHTTTPQSSESISEAIHTMTMATYTKIFFQFPEKFWFDSQFGIFAHPEPGHYPVWQSLDHLGFFPGSGILFATVTGDFAARIEVMPDEQVKAEAMVVIRTMYPNITVPEPLDFAFPRWKSDPLYRGSFSNWPPSCTSEHFDNLRANIGRVYFAGEATSKRYFGYLHGAYFEGADVGKIVADCVHDSVACIQLPRFPEVKNANPYRNY